MGYMPSPAFGLKFGLEFILLVLDCQDFEFGLEITSLALLVLRPTDKGGTTSVVFMSRKHGLTLVPRNIRCTWGKNKHASK